MSLFREQLLTPSYPYSPYGQNTNRSSYYQRLRVYARLYPGKCLAISFTSLLLFIGTISLVILPQTSLSTSYIGSCNDERIPEKHTIDFDYCFDHSYTSSIKGFNTSINSLNFVV